MPPDAAPQEAPRFQDIADRARIPQLPITYIALQKQFIQLQRTGYMYALEGVVTVNVTPSAGGTVTPKTTGVPTPENMIKEIDVYTNTQFSYIKLSGFDLYLLNRVSNLYDPRNPLATFDSATARSQVFTVPAGALTASTPVDISFPIYARVALGAKEMISLALLEGKGQIYCGITWEDIANNCFTLAGGGTVVVNSVSFTPETDSFLVPQVPYTKPDPSPVRVCSVQIDPLTNTGFDKFYPPNGGTILRMIMYYLDTTGARIPFTSMGNYRLGFGGIMKPESGTIRNLAQRQLRNYEGYALPNGVICFDFLGGNGDSSRQPSIRDTVNVRDANDFLVEIEINAGVSVGAGASRRVIIERLVNGVPV